MMTGPTDDEIRELGRLAFVVAHRVLGNRGEAEEVAQEAVTRTVLRWRRVHAYSAPFVQRVATNLAIGVFRNRRPAPTGVERTVDDAATADDRMDLVRALRRLPRRQRDVLAMRFLADLPERDVAAALGVSTGSVKQHTSRGLAALRLDLTATTPSPPEATTPPDPTITGANDAGIR